MIHATITSIFLLSVSFLIQYGLSLTVSEPSSGAIWHLHSPNLVKWKSVSTDPESVEIRIVNNNPAAFPTGFTKTIKDGINTADNKFRIDALPGIKPGKGYQVNIMSSAGTILAQSAQFSINGTMESRTATPTAHPNTQTITSPTIATPSPTSSSSTSDATSPMPNVYCQFIAITLASFGLLVSNKIRPF